MGDIEDWSVPGSHRTVVGGVYSPTGSRILSIQSGPDLFSSEELFIWEMVYQTIVDCYKIAIGHWQHFLPMRWHRRTEPENTIETAREYTRGWVNSGAFTDYVKLLGWNPDIAVSNLTILIDGLATPALLHEIKKQINQISKERDSRRNRSISHAKES